MTDEDPDEQSDELVEFEAVEDEPKAPGFIKFPCPRCMADIQVHGRDAGRRTTCRKCNKKVDVPGERVRPSAPPRAVRKVVDPEARERILDREDDRRARAERTVPAALSAFGVVLLAPGAVILLQGLFALFEGIGFGAPGLILIAVGGYLAKLGLDLRQGRRSAVIGLMFVLVLSVALDALLWKAANRRLQRPIVIVACVKMIVMGIPIAIGLGSWQRLR
jgi:hypothetical protein